MARRGSSDRRTGSTRGAVALLLLIAAGGAHAQPSTGATDPGADPASKANLRILPRCTRDPAASDDIVVCARRSETERQRLPRITPDRFDPNGPIDSVSRERHRLYEVGDTGIGSCSNSGPGGMSGCDFKRFKAWVEQHGK